MEYDTFGSTTSDIYAHLLQYHSNVFKILLQNVFSLQELTVWLFCDFEAHVAILIIYC